MSSTEESKKASLISYSMPSPQSKDAGNQQHMDQPLEYLEYLAGPVEIIYVWLVALNGDAPLWTLIKVVPAFSDNSGVIAFYDLFVPTLYLPDALCVLYNLIIFNF